MNREMNRKRNEYLDKIEKAKLEIHKSIIGLDELIDNMLICLFVPGRGKSGEFGGHLLIESIHGQGKTESVKTIIRAIDFDYKRVQCTHDMVATDFTGNEYPDPKDPCKSIFRKGPVFTDLLLVDECNRAPARAHSGFLEPMGENQLDINGTKYPMTPHFRVFATINPTEDTNSATFLLPMAQIDRFLINQRVDWLSVDDECKVIAEEMDPSNLVKKVIYKEDFDLISPFVREQFIAPYSSISKEIRLIQRIVDKTRNWSEKIDVPASTRAAMDIKRVAASLAFLSGEDVILPLHISKASGLVLRKRLVAAEEYSHLNQSPDDLIKDLLGRVSMF